MIVWIVLSLGWRLNRNEYVYNEHGWVVQELAYNYKAGAWVEAAQMAYELDDNGNVLVATEMDFDGENYVNYAKREYFYQEGLLIEEMEYVWNDGWTANNRMQYAYDDRNDCIETVMYYCIYPLQQPEWHYDKRYTYEFDNNHNCIKSEKYDYDYDYGWIADYLENVLYYYDLSMTSNSIAGLLFYGDYINKLLYYKEPILIAGSQSDEEHFMITQFHYSTITTVSESHEDKLNIWPNPIKDVLNLGTNDLQEVEIISIDGRKVLAFRNVSESINVSALPAGCYLMKAIKNDGIMEVQKIVKQ